MTQEAFNQLAQESVLFAIFLAETRGVAYIQIELWMHAVLARSVC